MTAVVVDVRAALEARAGASDEDRAAWLAERRTGVTATEMTQLYLKRISKEALAAQKLSGVETFFGNAYTEWGKQRESVIAAEVQREYGIAPESRVFRSALNDRWLASPDGIGIDFDELLTLSEIKTAGMDISITSPDFRKKGYLVQMVWAMGVLGAGECVYAWEERIGSPLDGFTPGLRHFDVVRFADHEQLWMDLQTIAGDFLAELDRQAAGVATVKHPALIRAEALLADYFEQDARAKANLAGLRSRIDEALVEAGAEKAAVEGIGSASVSVSKPGKRFDGAALKAAEPGMYAKYQKETPGGERTLRLTPAKQSGEVA